MNYVSHGSMGWRDLSREQLLEMLKPVRGDAPGPNAVATPPIVPVTGRPGRPVGLIPFTLTRTR